jgi:hypothetical protein
LRLVYFFVMPGLVPGIHVFLVAVSKTWMAGTSPAMTTYNNTPPQFRADAHAWSPR